MDDQHLKILLVDDDEDDYIITRDLLTEIKNVHYVLDWVSTYEEALQIFDRNEHDVYLLDFRLSDRNGLELLREALQRGCHVPMILITGQGDREIDIEAMQAGAADFLVKGQIDAATLERSIRYSIAQAHTMRALRESEERYAIAARGANDGLFDWNLIANTIYYSPRWKAMLGYEEQEISPDIQEWFDRVCADDLQKLKQLISAHRQGVTTHLEVEHRIRHKNGTYRWMLTRGLAVRDRQGAAYRLAGSQTDITERKVAEEQLLHDALHDTLTNLPNRALFMDRLEVSFERSKRHPEYIFAVLFLDVDRFKVINDSLGHFRGDQLLIAMARRLETLVFSRDTVARPGGDEFTLLLDDITDISKATRRADIILHELSKPFNLKGHEVFITVSIGIALSVTGYDQAEDILRDADTAMYRAKAQGRARHLLFDKDMHAHAVALLQLETDLRRATERQEFCIFYQPIISLLNGRIMGFEALARWQHPKRGIVPPDEFIPIAEETGLVIPIDQMVLRKASHQLHEWQQHFSNNRLLMVNTNLSSRQFNRPDLINLIDEILSETNLTHNSLGVEITESTIMKNPETAANLCWQLKERHIQLHIDDFGTGYSSLSYLHSFPLDSLKIDRSFVMKMGDDEEKLEIVRTIVFLAHNLNMQVMAEGVETRGHLTLLRGMKCDYCQGYFFSKPLPPLEAWKLLTKNPQW
ncbi:putative bifunctional diguanylate cyclase/phosphodiesterase [candidate division CSSED10-310 bacterium]|uniref:Bifunctional diguanylate cyclase/phosphodiesterase n=1 Tax=candidate division CSSED10-310 bacterium TaxID=2855610 RepID=A0ABV6Z699_UNCC1